MRRMSTFARQGLVAAMESEAAIAATAAPEEAGAENLETELLEVNEDEAVAADTDSQIEETVETAEALEAMRVSLESAAANGGLNKDAAHAVGIALDHMYKRIGVSSVKSMPALESFGQNSSRVAATQLALEDIGEKLKEIWKRIVEAVIKAYEWVKERFMNVFGAANKLERRAKALAERANGVAGKPGQTEIDSERLVQSLRMGAGIGDVVKGTDEVKSFLEVALSDKIKITEEAASAIGEGKADEFVTSFVAEAKLVAKNAVADSEAAGFGPLPEKTKLQRGDELLGGKAVIVRMTDSEPSGNGADVFLSAAKCKIGMGEYDPKAAKLTKTKLPTLAGPAAEQACKTVADIALVVQKYKTNLSKADAATKKLVAALNKAAKDTSSSENADEKKLGEAKAKFASVLPGLVSGLPIQAAAYGLNVGKSVCDYAELSIKQYKAA